VGGKLARLWDRAHSDLVARAEFARPDEMALHANASVLHLGVTLTIYLADHEQMALHALPLRAERTAPPLMIDGTVAGRAFTTIEALQGVEPGHWWIPLVDDAERLGVVEFSVHRPQLHGEDMAQHGRLFATLLAHLLVTKSPYGDALHRVRRTRSMAASGEMLLAMLPPSTFTCRGVVIAAILEPAYEVGGDAFDYAVDAAMAQFTVIDAMGHGLPAALTSAAVLATMRSARRDGHGLVSMAATADTALTGHLDDLRFATGILAELNIDHGLLRYLNAGHPPAVLLRQHHAIAELDAGRRPPLGIGDGQMHIAEQALEPGDRVLLYTDGVIEARSPQGVRFGLDRLTDLAERHAAAQLPAPEALRKLAHAVRSHRDGPLTDDATIMIIEWSPDAISRARP
jgi:hypothetical protein